MSGVLGRWAIYWHRPLADLGAGQEEEEEDEKNNDEKHAEIQREFNTKLNQATICYYHAQIHQLQPANDQAVRVRAIRASGVAKLKRMILKRGFSPDSVITCFEDLEHTRKNGLTPLHQLAEEQPQTMGAVPFIHHSSDPMLYNAAFFTLMAIIACRSLFVPFVGSYDI